MSTKQYAYFSAAIRDGAKLRPQAFGELFHDGKTCSLGAGAEAMGVADIGESWMVIANTFPYLAIGVNRAECPVKDTCPHLTYPLYKIITHLNDNHFWTREAIADWLYAEEEKLGFVTISDESEAHKIPEAGRGDSVVTEAQAGVLTKRF